MSYIDNLLVKKIVTNKSMVWTLGSMTDRDTMRLVVGGVRT